VLKELNYTNFYALKELDDLSVDLLKKLYNATLNTDRELDSTVVELKELDNITVDAVGKSNNTILNAPIESDNATYCVLKDFKNAIDVLQESMAIDVLDIIEVD
jgi:hypothetical protein